MAPDRDEKPTRAPRPLPVVWAVVFAVVIVLLAVGGGAVVWQRYVAAPRQRMEEANALLHAAVSRRLTDDEFDRVVALVGTDAEAAQLAAIVALDRATYRSPSRRDRALAALDECRQAAASGAVRDTAALTATAMRESPFLRDELVLSEAALTRGLTDDEFDRAVALLGATAEATQLSAVQTLVIAVARTPARRGRTVEVLEACREAASPAVRAAAGEAATRLKGPPPAPPNPQPAA